MTEIHYYEPKFFAEGDVRSQICSYGGLRAAINAIKRDRKACAAQGGYSDAVPMVYMRRRPDEVPSYGHNYGVGYETDDDGQIVLTVANRMNVQRVLKAIGEEIANGNGRYYPRLKEDRWKGWVVDGGALYKVSMRWPDTEETTEQLLRRMDVQHICDVLK